MLGILQVRQVGRVGQVRRVGQVKGNRFLGMRL